jgi:hypothetical protein
MLWIRRADATSNHPRQFSRNVLIPLAEPWSNRRSHHFSAIPSIGVHKSKKYYLRQLNNLQPKFARAHRKPLPYMR